MLNKESKRFLMRQMDNVHDSNKHQCSRQNEHLFFYCLKGLFGSFDRKKLILSQAFVSIVTDVDYKLPVSSEQIDG